MGADGAFYGTVYAPLAQISVKKELEVFGAVIAKHLDFEPGSQLHFDHYLAVLDAASTLPRQHSWRIVDFAPIGNGSDPFVSLGVVKTALKYPADSHKDQWLDITYTDLSKTTQAYSGLESAFDWAQVYEVIDAARDGTSTDMMNTDGQNAMKGDNLMML